MRHPTNPDVGDERPLLLVASAGGHLTQLEWLRHRLRPGGDRRVVWATSQGPQADALPGDDELVATRSIPPRDLIGVLRTVPLAVRTCRRVRPVAVVSTGSAIALAFLPVAALLGIPAIYIESATRDVGPSVTGRILRLVPRVQLCTQSPLWARGRWHHVGSVLDGFEPEPAAARPRPIRSAVVTVGTMGRYPFRRLVERLVEILPADADVLWQTGCTPVEDLDIPGHESLPSSELRDAIAHADVVIAHAGTGTAITALEQGRCPVLVPREHAHGEHVDDHQAQTAARLQARGLAIAVRAEELRLSVLEEATRHSVSARADAPTIPLL